VCESAADDHGVVLRRALCAMPVDAGRTTGSLSILKVTEDAHAPAKQR
jgi:hypothetical protein